MNKLYNDFMLWRMHGIESDVLNTELRPEYSEIINKAKDRLAPNSSEIEILDEVERILEKLEATES